MTNEERKVSMINALTKSIERSKENIRIYSKSEDISPFKEIISYYEGQINALIYAIDTIEIWLED